MTLNRHSLINKKNAGSGLSSMHGSSKMIIFFEFRFSFKFAISMVSSNLCLLIVKVRASLYLWIYHQTLSLLWLQDCTSNHLHVLRNIFILWIQNTLDILQSMFLTVWTFLLLSLTRIWIVPDLRLRSLLLSLSAPIILPLNGDLDRHLQIPIALIRSLIKIQHINNNFIDLLRLSRIAAVTCALLILVSKCVVLSCMSFHRA